MNTIVLVANALIMLILIWVIVPLLKAYASQKGQNIATKEDIGIITDKVEKVRTEYLMKIQELQQQNALVLENVRSHNKLKMAALDKRLEAHQQAYRLWRELIFTAHDKEKVSDVVVKCQSWWNNNCLYLDEKSRDAFYKATNLAFIHNDIKKGGNSDEIKRNWGEILFAGELIIRGVELPPIKGDFEEMGVKEE